MNSIELKNVKKIYNGNVLAVDNFNLRTEKKEFVVFVGPSGCGKSTTLRMIAGLEDITQGEIFIDSTLINNVHPKDRDIAMVFQNYALYPHMTVYDNMAFPLKMKKVNKKDIKDRVETISKRLGLMDYLKRRPKEISGGQRQRVALGRAIVRKPKIFLLDEPLSNLDAKLRTKMRMELIQLYQSLDATFIYVTHDQVEAMTMGTIIVVMKDGEIQQIGSPQEIYDYPQNLFVATFLGSPQMNIAKATLVKEKEDYYLDKAGKRINIDTSKEIYKDCLEQYAGKEINFGIRPSALKVSEGEVSQRTSALDCEVEVVELMGEENIIHVASGNDEYVLKTTKDFKPKIGETIKVYLSYSEIHLFDSETGQTICN